MLNKIFGNKLFNSLVFNKVASHGPPSEGPSSHAEKRSRALKIIHMGGLAEHYYMAIPAARIIEKHPSFVLARPEIFRRPWDSIVRPEEILVPGQRYYVVPRQTVKKLRRRIKRSGISFIPKSSLENVSHVKDSMSISVIESSIMVKPGTKVKAQNRHVRFLDLETKKKESGSGSTFVPRDHEKGNDNYKVEKGMEKKLTNLQVRENRMRDRIENSWEPSLNAIDESSIEY